MKQRAGSKTRKIIKVTLSRMNNSILTHTHTHSLTLTFLLPRPRFRFRPRIPTIRLASLPFPPSLALFEISQNSYLSAIHPLFLHPPISLSHAVHSSKARKESIRKLEREKKEKAKRQRRAERESRDIAEQSREERGLPFPPLFLSFLERVVEEGQRYQYVRYNFSEEESGGKKRRQSKVGVAEQSRTWWYK